MTELVRVAGGCWSTIGVRGDRSCEKLARVQHCQNCPVFEQAARSFLDRPVPAAYADEMGDVLCEPAALRGATGRSLVVFELCAQTLAIDTTAVVEIAAARTVRRIVHRSNRVFLGLVNVHGQLELCASLEGLMQIERPGATNPAGERLILVEHAGQRWAFLVDAVLGVQRIEAAQASSVPAAAQHDSSFYVAELLAWERRQVGRVDLEKTFVAFQRSLG